jgi:hypothetical protein
MGEAAPVEAGDTADKKRPRLRRIPTSLIATLVGIALTAWLLPAFTRQWSDRQKAQELQTAVTAEMAAATASALVGGEAIWSGRHINGSRVADAWSLASLKIEARLHAYFDPQIVTAWQIFEWFIDRFDDGYRMQALGSLQAAADTKYDLKPDAAAAAALVFVTGRDIRRGEGPSFRPRNANPYGIEYRALQYLAIQLHPWMETSKNRFAREAGAVEIALFALEQEIAREVLAAHPKGYSTTARDLIHDLIP